MKAEDLMLGDWVLCDGTPMKVTELKFKGVSEERLISLQSDSCIFRNIILDDRIQPIPLTSEILEKNGFEKNRGYGYYIGQSNSGYHIYFDNNYLFIQAGYDIIEFVWCEYVHELQHALKLCGIDKEIVL